MRNPSIYTPNEIKNWDCSVNINNKYIPARPLPWSGFRLFKNLKISWFVFIGKYDALDWRND